MSRMDGVQIVKLDMCAFGMMSQDEDGVGLVKKPTSMMTNSPEVGKRLDKRCCNKHVPDEEKHRHVQLVCGRASHAKVYPRALCRAVCEGVASQKRMDSRNLVMLDVMSITELNELGADDLHENHGPGGVRRCDQRGIGPRAGDEGARGGAQVLRRDGRL